MPRSNKVSSYSYESRGILGEASEHHANGGNAHAGFTASDGLLVILAQAAVESQPGEGPFDDPALLQQHESLGTRRPALDLQRQMPSLQSRDGTFAVVPAV